MFHFTSPAERERIACMRQQIDDLVVLNRRLCSVLSNAMETTDAGERLALIAQGSAISASIQCAIASLVRYSP